MTAMSDDDRERRRKAALNADRQRRWRRRNSAMWPDSPKYELRRPGRPRKQAEPEVDINELLAKVAPVLAEMVAGLSEGNGE